MIDRTTIILALLAVLCFTLAALLTGLTGGLLLHPGMGNRSSLPRQQPPLLHFEALEDARSGSSVA